MEGKIKKIILFSGILVLIFFIFDFTSAHRSGCHRWHSCPSDSGSYTCGDLGYPCQYPTYPASGGVIYPPSGYYKDCYDCPLKKVPANAYTSGYDWYCESGYEKVGDSCEKIIIPENAYTVGSSWECNVGYIKRDNKCISHTENCINYFGANVYGKKGSNNNSDCYCNIGYEWNLSKTTCIKSLVCPTNASVIAGGCVCDESYEWDISGRNCILIIEIENSSSVQNEQYPEVEEEISEKFIEEDLAESEKEENQLQKENNEKEKDQKAPIQIFLANVLNAIKKFFSQFFR